MVPLQANSNVSAGNRLTGAEEEKTSGKIHSSTSGGKWLRWNVISEPYKRREEKVKPRDQEKAVFFLIKIVSFSKQPLFLEP